MGDIRQPIKKTSIEKKNKIIEQGFLLMCNSGYHNVTCVDIAKQANVSTGIIYQYFNDKRDIFIEGVKDYANKILFPLIDILDTQKFDKHNLKNIINNIIESYIKTHTMSKKAHEQLLAMSHLDSEVSEILNKSEITMTDKISKIIINNGINIDNIEEKVHIIIGIIDNFCHEVVYHKHSNLNYDMMKKDVINSIIYLLNGLDDNNEKI